MIELLTPHSNKCASSFEVDPSSEVAAKSPFIVRLPPLDDCDVETEALLEPALDPVREPASPLPTDCLAVDRAVFLFTAERFD